MSFPRLGLLAHHAQVCDVKMETVLRMRHDLPNTYIDNLELERLGSRQGDVPRGNGLGAGHLL